MAAMCHSYNKASYRAHSKGYLCITTSIMNVICLIYIYTRFWVTYRLDSGIPLEACCFMLIDAVSKFSYARESRCNNKRANVINYF